MKTSKKQTLQNTEDRLTLFLVDSLANHTVTLGSEEARKMTVTSGQRCAELFGRYNHVSLWAKMLLGCLVGTTEWYSTKLLLTWKMKDMRHKRFLFQLVPRMPHTEEIEFSLLPTPMAQNRETTLDKTLERKEKYGGEKRAMYLENYAVMELLPTPRVKGHGNSHQRIEDGKIDDLTTMAKRGMLPTPRQRDWKGCERYRNDIPSFIEDKLKIIGKTSQLNPLFVAEMMGFPPNWTVLPFQRGETNQLRDTEMP